VNRRASIEDRRLDKPEDLPHTSMICVSIRVSGLWAFRSCTAFHSLLRSFMAGRDARSIYFSAKLRMVFLPFAIIIGSLINVLLLQALDTTKREVIHELLLAVTAEVLPADIARITHAHSTLSEALMEAMRMAEG